MDDHTPPLAPDPLGEESAAQRSHLRTEGERLVGEVLCERYRVLSVLDHGGMGVIYRAQQIPLNRPVALKVLHPSMATHGDPEFRDRFLLEASTAARLKHPNTVTIYDFGEFAPGSYYIAMELLEGESLGQRLKRDGHLEPVRALRLLQKVCGSLGEAHDAGVVHRDVKPANIFLVKGAAPRADGKPGAGEDVKMLDFGLVKTAQGEVAHVTQKGIMVGSPRFMSPEQIRVGEVDPRSDIYSLGAVLYRCVTGHFLFDSAEHLSIVFAHVHDAPRPFDEVCPELDLPFELEALVLRCLAKDPADRYQSMAELSDAMDAVIERLGSPAPGSGPRASSAGGLRPEAEGALPLGGNTVSLRRAEAPLSIETHASGPRGGLAPVVVIMALLLGGGAWALWGEGGAEAPAPPQAGPVAEPAAPPARVTTRRDAPAPEEAPPEPLQAVVPIQVSTLPQGATLFRGDADLGDAPLILPIPRGEEWTLEVRHPGYETRTVRILGGQERVTLRLRPLPERAAAPAPRAIDAEGAAPAAPPPVKAPSPEPSVAPARPSTDLRDPWSK